MLAIAAASPPRRSAPAKPVNPANDKLVKLAPAERAGVLARVVGHWCIGTETFLMGVVTAGTRPGQRLLEPALRRRQHLGGAGRPAGRDHRDRLRHVSRTTAPARSASRNSERDRGHQRSGWRHTEYHSPRFCSRHFGSVQLRLRISSELAPLGWHRRLVVAAAGGQQHHGQRREHRFHRPPPRPHRRRCHTARARDDPDTASAPASATMRAHRRGGRIGRYQPAAARRPAAIIERDLHRQRHQPLVVGDRQRDRTRRGVGIAVVAGLALEAGDRLQRQLEIAAPARPARFGSTRPTHVEAARAVIDRDRERAAIAAAQFVRGSRSARSAGRARCVRYSSASGGLRLVSPGPRSATTRRRAPRTAC